MLKKVIIIIPIIVVIGVILYFVQKPKDQQEYVTQEVTRTNLVQTVDATGKIESAEKINLNFKIVGQISNITAEVGEHVAAGTVLARLRSQTLQSQVKDAQAKVDQAQANYDKILAGASNEDIKVAENNVAQKDQAVSTAKNDQVNLENSKSTQLQNLKETAITDMNNEIITARGAIDEIDNTLSDPDAQKTLSAQDTSALSRARISESNAIESIMSTQITVNTVSVLSSDQTVLSALDGMKTTLSDVAQALTDTLTVLSVTVTSTNFTETELDTLKTNIKAQQVKINTAQSNIQTAKTNWTNKIVYYQDKTTEYEDAVKEAEAALQKAQSELALKKSSPRDFEISSAKAKIDQAKASLNLAHAKLNESVIRAPVDGTIIKKNYEVGEQTMLSTPVLEMISDTTLQIEVDIPESDIAVVTIGQPAKITFDALSDDEVFMGAVTFIDPAETIIQDVVYYKVKTQLEEQDTRIKPGMTANVTILTRTKENTLTVPSRAIKTRGNEKYVEILVNNLPQEKIITTGLRGDTGVEVISGLKEGDEVITFVKE